MPLVQASARRDPVSRASLDQARNTRVVITWGGHVDAVCVFCVYASVRVFVRGCVRARMLGWVCGGYVGKEGVTKSEKERKYVMRHLIRSESVG